MSWQAVRRRSVQSLVSDVRTSIRYKTRTATLSSRVSAPFRGKEGRLGIVWFRASFACVVHVLRSRTLVLTSLSRVSIAFFFAHIIASSTDCAGVSEADHHFTSCTLRRSTPTRDTTDLRRSKLQRSATTRKWPKLYMPRCSVSVRYEVEAPSCLVASEVARKIECFSSCLRFRLENHGMYRTRLHLRATRYNRQDEA